MDLPFAAGSNSQQYTAAYIGYLSSFYGAPGPTDSNHYFPGAYIHDGRNEIVLTKNLMNGGESMPTLSTNTNAGIMIAGSYSAINS